MRKFLFPSFPIEKFCGPVEMAPGLFVEAYVPTQRDFGGDFSAFGVALLDPLTHDGSILTVGISLGPVPEQSASPQIVRQYAPGGFFRILLTPVSPLRNRFPLSSLYVARRFLLHLRVDLGEPRNRRSGLGRSIIRRLLGEAVGA